MNFILLQGLSEAQKTKKKLCLPILCRLEFLTEIVEGITNITSLHYQRAVLSAGAIVFLGRKDYYSSSGRITIPSREGLLFLRRRDSTLMTKRIIV